MTLLNMPLPLPCFFLLIFFVFPSHSIPLTTSDRWIIDQDSGDRQRLACINWLGHLQVMIPEGLNKKPMEDIVLDISDKMGFNCVRLTWATYMYTRYSDLKVSESLDRLNLTVVKDGVAKNNPEVLEMTVVEAQEAVVYELGKRGLMVVLDNHVSLPEWCCSDNDGNGFFWDENFDGDEWVRGLVAATHQYKFNPTVVAMSLRNELRGPHQHVLAWYYYMQQGGSAIHQENPDVLVIFSGLSYDTDLSFLKIQPLTIDLDSTTVFEAHWYPFGQQPEKWIFQTNEYCANMTKLFMDNCGFLLQTDEEDSQFPIFLSAFGLDQRGGDEMENRYFVCVLVAIADNDIDWAFWQLAGSYMLREGNVDVEDVFGMYDSQWKKLRNPTIVERLEFIQTNIQGFVTSRDASAYVLYHPLSGRCVEASSYPLFMSNCGQATQWEHTQDGGPINIRNTNRCLTIVSQGSSPVISDQNDCKSPQSSWNVVSVSKNHLASKDNQGNHLCLEVDLLTSKVVTNKCLCLDDDLRDVSRCEENPQRQWLKLIPISNRSNGKKNRY